VQGNNANAGTSASAPKRDLSGVNVDGLAAGSQLLFARGGAWSMSLTLQNTNATAASPLVFDAYGSGPAPVWRTSSGSTVNTGAYGNTVNDGGYVFRNLKMEGGGMGSWAFFLHDNVHDVTIENVEMSGHAIGVHSQSINGNVSRITVRNSNIHHNVEHGFLGSADDLVIEGTTFANNNMDGGGLEHGIYLGGNGRNATIRSNTFTNNSAPGGVCNGGNLTVHGQWDGILIEGNTVSQADSVIQCYGISLNPGYDSAEWMRNVVIRNNTTVDVGCGICTSSTPGVVVEGNRIIQTVPRAAGINVGLAVPDPGDVADSGAVVRNNTGCYVAGGQSVVSVGSIGAIVANNTVVSGAAATTGVCAR